MKRLKVTVIDMQPITPAVGGGRQRLLGLYHALGPNIDAVYVGSYDWRGESFRDQRLTPVLREVLVPLTETHHAAADALAADMAGRVMIDLAFCDQVHLSPEYLAMAREHILDADIVVFEHPWAYPALCDAMRPAQLLVYDAQNVESVLRVSLHEDLPKAASVLARAVEVEYQLCRDADLVVACSHEDREIFARVYGLPLNKLRVVPNGIFAFAHPVPDEEDRIQAKQELGLTVAPLVVFIGSDYGPNNEAAAYIVRTLALAVPAATYALIGSCCNMLATAALPANVKLLGVLEETQKQQWMRAADVAVNPLTAGSGTSIKMFDFMAAGLPTITTAIGARGIASTGEPALLTRELEQFPGALHSLLSDIGTRDLISARARKTVESFYAWERISPRLGQLLCKRLEQKRHAQPFFSVVVPSYARHALLDRLVAMLRAQEERDFEVIIVDQSASRWPNEHMDFGIKIHYVHSEVKGAVNARNLGGYLATGRVIAFTDDDCEPSPSWLANARKRLSDESIAGIEGLIRSDHHNDPEWRTVTNVGFEGIGYMTANLFVRNDVFQILDGFDLSFDDPNFREDTDFGWRAQACGQIPYAADVEVYHPAHRRDIQRESRVERNRFFEKDALLVSKHPERYRELFLAEAHYQNTAGFWENLLRGAEKYRVSLPGWLDEHRPKAGTAHTGKGSS